MSHCTCNVELVCPCSQVYKLLVASSHAKQVSTPGRDALQAKEAGAAVTRVDVGFTAFRLQLGWLAFSLPLGWVDPKVSMTAEHDSFGTCIDLSAPKTC